MLYLKYAKVCWGIMKGIIFREFIDMVEAQFSPQMVDDIIQASTLASG